MSTINSLFSSQPSSFDYSSPRAKQQAYEQVNTPSQQAYDQLRSSQTSFSEYRSGGMPSWSELDESHAETWTDTVDDSHLSEEERLTNRVMEEIKTNGFDILGAVEAARADLFQDLFEKELENNNGDAVAALEHARANMPGGMSAAELKTTLEGMLDDILENGIDGVPITNEVKEALEETLAAIDIEMSNEELDKLLTGDEEEPASDSFSGDKPIHTDEKPSHSTTPTGSATVWHNKEYTSEESYRIEALAFTKAQFAKENDLENNKEARAVFDARLADNMAGKNRNDRSVSLMHYIA